MKMIHNLEAWVLYGGNRDERVRIGFDKAGYLGFLTFLCGGVAIHICHRLADIPGSAEFHWACLLMVSVVVFSAALVLKGATALDTRKQQKALISLGIFCVPFLYLLMVLFSEKTDVWYKGAGPLALFGGSVAGSALVVLCVWSLHSLARRRSEKLSRGPE